MICGICKSKDNKLVWKDKIRNSQFNFTSKKYEIVECLNCSVTQLKKKSKYLEDSALARNLYNNNNSIKEFIDFHKPRETKKIKFIEKYINFKNKKILESNCGAGVILDILKNKAKFRAGLDSIHYKNYLANKVDKFFTSIDKINKSNIKFDIVLSLSELEHKYNPLNFLEQIKSVLTQNGTLVLRVPNYDNIYKYLCGNDFLKYDFRTSHNFYFSRKSLFFIYKKVGFKIFKEFGFNEYSFNHLLTFFQKRRRIKKDEILSYVNFKKNRLLVKNIEKNFLSTSLVYILKKI
jgi:SAM-dependent methyltransferase